MRASSRTRKRSPSDEIAKDSKDRQLASDAFIRRATLLRANPELNKAASLTNSVNVVPAVKPTP